MDGGRETYSLSSVKRLTLAIESGKAFYSFPSKLQWFWDSFGRLLRHVVAIYGTYCLNLEKYYHFIRKVPYKLSRERKRGIRERLRNVEKVINILNTTGIRTQSLVQASAPI
jgi:hypothetical protein